MFWLTALCILFFTFLMLILLWPTGDTKEEYFDEEQHRIDLFGDKH